MQTHENVGLMQSVKGIKENQSKVIALSLHF